MTAPAGSLSARGSTFATEDPIGHERKPPDTAELRSQLHRVADWAADYRSGVEQRPVQAPVAPGDVAALLERSPPDAAHPLEKILADLDRIIVPGLTHWNHPGFFAWFSSSASTPAQLAETAIAALGVNAMSWRTSPAATELEELVVSWLAELAGLRPAFRGVILDTASTGSFTALVAAREAIGLEVRQKGLAGRTDVPRLTLYASEHAHFSIGKAAMAAGLGLDNVRRVPVDARFRMDPAALRRRIEEDRAAGALPVMVVATIGTTSSTSVDPAAEIADVCEEFGVWLHVDAAYAGSAALLPELRGEFEGWERADSIVLNPHKWLFTSMDCSVLLFRDPETVRRSLALTAAYLSGDERATDLMDYGLPLGRRFRALKLWFVIRWFGAEGLRAILRDHIGWARDFSAWMEEDPRFEIAAPAPFSTVCFRAMAPAGEDGDAWNRALLDTVNGRGRVFLSDTELDGRRTLRLSVGSVNSTADHVRLAYEELAAAYETMQGEAT